MRQTKLTQIMNSKILQKLDELKKPCHKIIFKKYYKYWEEVDKNIWKTSNCVDDALEDDKGRFCLFQIFNFKGSSMPQNITKIQYFDCGSDKLVVSTKPEKSIPANEIEIENGLIDFEPALSLPDWETLENFFVEDYQFIKKIIKEENPELLDEYEYYEIYDKYVEKTIGHELHSSFIGGYLNQCFHFYPDKELYEKYQFIMQIDIETGIIHIFQNLEDETVFKHFLAHT